jgi:hypothetical protein
LAETDPFAPLQDLLAKRKEAAANKPAPTARVPGALDVALKQVREKKAEVQEARFGAPPDDLKERTQYLQETLGVQTPSYTDSEGNAVETSDAPTTAPQPQTVPAVVEEAVAAQEPAQAPLDPYAALQTDLGGLSLKETKEVEDVEKQINAREATRAAEWIDFDRSAAENAATVFAKALGKQEDVFRAIIKGFELPGGNYRMPGLNALGVDWAVPGQSDEDVAMARELLIRTPTIKGEISRATGIPEGAIRISATPQDKTVGMAYNETVAAITDIQYLKLLQEANATVASGISQAEKNGLRVKARKFAIQQADSASAAAIGRNFPVIERDSNATAKWISEWGPLWRPILAGYYQDNATIRLPNGEHYEEDLTQNTFFGGLEWAVQAISPTTKPFAAGAITGEKLGKDDILEFLDNPALMAFGALSASAAVEMSMPDGYETSIPYDVSEEGVKHMRRGEDLISQHDKLGGAAGEYLWSPAGADASLAEQGGKAIAQTWLSAIHRMNPITGYMLYNGWTDAQITSVAFTAAGALLEPDAFMAVAPLKAGAKLGSGLYKARKAAKIDTRVGEILTKMDTPVQVLDDAGDAVVDATGKPVMELPRVDEMELSKLLVRITG